MTRWEELKQRRKERSRKLIKSIVDVLDEFIYEYYEACYHENEAEKEDCILYLQNSMNQLELVRTHFVVTPKMRSKIHRYFNNSGDIYQLYNNVSPLLNAMGYHFISKN